MNRDPKIGDVIVFGKKRDEHLVTSAGPTWFNAVPVGKADPVTGAIDGSKEVKYHLYETAPTTKAKFTPHSEIRLVATARFKAATKVTYTITKVKDV